MITFGTAIEGLSCHSHAYDKRDVVWKVHWRLIAIDGEASQSMPFDTRIPYKPGDFTPFADIDQTQVLTWIDRYEDKEAVSAAEAVLRELIEQELVAAQLRQPPWIPEVA